MRSRLDAFVTSRTAALRMDCRPALEVAGWEHDIAVVQTTVYKACDEGVESVYWHRSLDGLYLPE